MRAPLVRGVPWVSSICCSILSNTTGPPFSHARQQITVRRPPPDFAAGAICVWCLTLTAGRSAFVRAASFRGSHPSAVAYSPGMRVCDLLRIGVPQWETTPNVVRRAILFLRLCRELTRYEPCTTVPLMLSHSFCGAVRNTCNGEAIARIPYGL